MAVAARAGFIFQYQFKSPRPVSEGGAGVYLEGIASRINTMREPQTNKAQSVEAIEALRTEIRAWAELLHSGIIASDMRAINRVDGGHRIPQFNAPLNRSLGVRSRGAGETHANIAAQSIARRPSRTATGGCWLYVRK